jgi:serine/threonine protein kinase
MAAATAAAASIPISTINFSKYEDGVRVELGRGSFGVVFAAKYEGVDVAAKCLHEDVADEEKFLREAALQYSLKHKHVVTVFGVSVDTRRPGKRVQYVIMERMVIRYKKRFYTQGGHSTLLPYGNECSGSCTRERLCDSCTRIQYFMAT